MLRRAFVLFCSLATSPLFAATLLWDANGTTTGQTNGAGTWDTTTANWWDGSGNTTWPGGTTIAQFGGGTPTSNSTVTVSGTVAAGGLDFVGYGVAPASGQQYTITGGTINLASDALITLGDFTSTGSIFVRVASVLTGNNLTVKKSGGTTVQYISFGAANPNLTGTLTIGGNNGGLFFQAATANVFSGVSTVVVESSSCFAASGAGGIYNMAFQLAGLGGTSDYGAIRIDSNNITMTGAMSLLADTQIRTNIEVTGALLTNSITESGGSRSFTRVAAYGLGTLTLTAPSSYSGSTSLGKTGSNQGGITILDFSAANAPATNLLYNNVATAGALNLFGGTGSTTALVLRGKSQTVNAQSFGDVTASGTRSSIELTAGTAGSMTANLGKIIRGSAGLLHFSVPARGAINTTQADGFLGPWATFEDTLGRKSWAAVKGGTVTGFTGDLTYVSGITFPEVSGFSSMSNVKVDGSSTGNVTSGTSTTLDVATVTFADSTNARTLDIGAGKTLRLGAVGGIQAVAGSKPVTVGLAGSAGTLTAGGAASTAGQIMLTNYSSGPMTINSAIANNGASVVTLYVNGTGNVILPNASTYSGTTTIAGGTVEISNNTSLGTTTGATSVMQGAALRIAGSLTIGEAFTLGSLGVANDGGIRSSSGDTTMTGLISLVQPSRINVDSGTLTLARGTPAANNDVLSGGQALYLGGSGNMIINSRIAISSSTLTKDGTGTVSLRGNNNYTGPTTINSGTLHLDFPNAATTTNLLYNSGTGAAAASAGTLNLAGGTLLITGHPTTATSQTFGALATLVGASNLTYAQNGSPSLTSSFTGFSRGVGGVLNVTLPTTGNVTVVGGTNNAIITANSAAYMTIGNNDWAATDSSVTTVRNIVGLSSITGGYTPSTASTLTGNADIASGIATTTVAANVTPTSLRFNQGQATTITQSGTRTLSTGGILVTPAVGANTTTISTSILRSVSTTTGVDLVIFQNNPDGDLVINSSIQNNGNANALTKAGPGTVILNGTNTYSGVTRIHAGTLAVRGSLAATTEIQLGSGNSSGRLVLGSDASMVTQTVSALQGLGYGSANAAVGGSANSVSLLRIGGATAATSRFTNGTIGGATTAENNIALELDQPAGLLQLGNANSYSGKTAISQGMVEVGLLANSGTVSSLGTGTTDPLIYLGDSSATGSVTATLRYVGSSDSTTDRLLALSNSGTASAVTAEIESSGLGTLKFTQPIFNFGGNTTATRLVRLTGSNLGGNEIVGVMDGPAGSVTSLEKTGVGTWKLTGASTYGGVTRVKEGTVIVSGSISGKVEVGDQFSNITQVMFRGSGTVGDLTIFGSGFAATSGSSVDPGNAEDVAGILRTNAFSVTNGAHLSLQIGGILPGTETTAGYDQIVAAGQVALTGGDLKLSLFGAPVFSPGDTFYLVVNNGTASIAGTLSTLNGNAFNPQRFYLGGQEFQLIYDANYSGPGSDDLPNDLALVAVPEPRNGAALLGGVTLLGLLRLRRRTAI